LLEGGSHVNDTVPSPLAVLAGFPGATGSVAVEPPAGVKETAGDEAGPNPEWFRAFTVTVYDVPLERPVRVHVVAVAPAAVHVAFPGLAVAV
jgi:hypothetical protein